MERLFVYIVDRPYAGCRDALAGLTSLSWLLRAFMKTPHSAVTEDAEIEERPAAYIAVIPTTMPLVTEELLRELSEEMERRAIPSMEIGEGRIYAREAFGKEPKSSLRHPAFRSVEKAAERVEIERELYRRNAEISAQNGAIIPDVDNVWIDAASRIKRGAFIAPFTFVTGSEVEEGARIGPFSTVEDSVVSAGASVLYSVVKESVIGERTTVGPFAYVRMGSAIGAGCRIGDFVEVKASFLAEGVKAAHLAYIGDAEVGRGTNVGCGTVFANYDGKKKHKTKVGERVFIGANTNLVAPVSIGDEAYIAAATTVTKDVPQGSFVIGRSRAECKKRE